MSTITSRLGLEVRPRRVVRIPPRPVLLPKCIVCHSRPVEVRYQTYGQKAVIITRTPSR
jgi:hypothetical protein